MDKILLRRFVSRLSQLEGKEYLLSSAAYAAAPTLSGVKPSSLIAFRTKGKNLYQLWEKYKYDVCRILNVQFYELKSEEERVLVLFYNQNMLEKHITGDKKQRVS